MSDLTLPLAGISDPAQLERTVRARSAIRAGLFHITRVSSQQWAVKNGEKHPYTVGLKGDTWVCTCMDYRQHGPQIRCKHIEGVRLAEAAQNQIIQAHNEEQQMDQPNSKEGSERFDRILWELRQPLDMSRVRRRQAPGSGSVPYLEGYDMIDRANEIFGFAWSFDLLGEPVIARWQKKVLAWSQPEKRKVPVTDANGNVQVEEVGIVYITGKVSVTLGDHSYSHADLGRCIFTGDTPEALDMALAGSVTDCLKRCFRQLGSQFGNDLYDKEIAQNAGTETRRDGRSTTSNRSQATRTPSAAQTASKTAVRTYGDGSSVNGNVTEQEAFDTYKKRTGAVPTSKDALRAWMAAQRTPPVAA